MKTILRTLVIAAVLGGAALAQETPPMYVGGSFGVVFVAGFAGVPVTAQFGVEDVGVPGLDVRGSASYYVTGGGFEIGVDGLYNFPIQEGFTGYAGGGPRVLIGGGAVGFGLGLVGGAEFEVAPSVGLFGEVNTNVYFAGPFGFFVPGLRVGANYHIPQ